MSKIQNLLFDLDGTLADPMVAFEESLNFALESMGRTALSRSQIRKCIGPPLHKSLVEILGFNESEVNPIMTTYRNHHEKNFLNGYHLYEGIEQSIRKLKTRYRIFLATSKPHPFAKPLIIKFHLQPYFTSVYGSELDGTRSDKADLIAHVVKEQGLKQEECVMIGDRKFDILGAKKNNMRSLGVLWGYGDRKELEEAGADQIFAEPKELVKLAEED